MELAALIVSFGILTVSAAAATAALVQARIAVGAKDSAEIARDEAVLLSRAANDAFIRQAKAQEEANELTRASLPVPTVRFELKRRDGANWAIGNDGDAMAYGTLVQHLSGLVVDLEPVRRDVGPGDAVYFSGRSLQDAIASVSIEYFDTPGHEGAPIRLVRTLA